MSTKHQKIKDFDPSQPGQADATIYGLPFDAEESDFVVMAVPWEVTVSYGAGASEGPDGVLEASYQVDLLHQQFPDLWKLGIYFDGANTDWKAKSMEHKEIAQSIIEAFERGETIEAVPELKEKLERVNKACAQLNEEVKQRTLSWLDRGKKVVLLGGDHSTPLGYYRALAEKYDSFGILHLDAHMDLRKAYEGFTYSHASIMYNTLQLPQMERLVQVGIRDFCEQELQVVQEFGAKVQVYTDSDLKEKAFEGKNWKEQCDEIIGLLPQNVVVSFDIDALVAWYCPNTGTPVPGGLSFEQATYLLTQLARSNKKIIGMDLVEVALGSDDWDGNVGARLLFHMCGVFAQSQGMSVGEKIEFQN